MRIPIILSLGLLFASTAIASSDLLATDPLGDESIAGFDFGLGESGTCHDAAIDLREVAVISDDETIRVELLVQDVGSGRAYCPFQRIERGYMEGEVMLRSECDPAQPLLCARLGPSFFFFVDSERPACVAILLPDGAGSDACVGTGAFDGNRVTWTVPIAGTFLTREGDTRSFDARGTTAHVDAKMSGQYGPTVAGEFVPVLTLDDRLDENTAVTL